MEGIISIIEKDKLLQANIRLYAHVYEKGKMDSINYYKDLILFRFQIHGIYLNPTLPKLYELS